MSSLHTRLRQHLDSVLGQFSVDQICLCSDMTGTLLDQSDDGSRFSAAMKQHIADFLAKRGVLVVISGDCDEIIREHLFDRLPGDSSTIYYAASAGATIGAFSRQGGVDNYRSLYHVEPAKTDLLRSLLLRVEAVLSQVVGSFAFTADEWGQFLNPQGGARLDVSHRLNLSEITWIECRPEKGIALFFPQARYATGVPAQLLQQLAADIELNELAKRFGLHRVSGPNFVDVILTHKGEALARLAQIDELRETFKRRKLIFMGDSANDRDMFIKAPQASPILFVGAETDFEKVTGGVPEALFVGNYTKGIEVFFEVLLGK